METLKNREALKISIIIGTYSKERYDDLVDLLEKIRSQTYDNIETIVVADNNRELYNMLVERHRDIKVVLNLEQIGLSCTRNVGVNNATGDIIAFIDDDAVPDNKWAENIARTFDSNYSEIGAVTGSLFPQWRTKNDSVVWFPKELFWMIGCSYTMTPDHRCEVERGFGSNMAIKKDIFDKVGLFNTELGVKGKKWVGGEDTDMYLKIKNSGKKIIFSPNIIVFHKINPSKISFINLIKRAFDGGFSIAMLKTVCKYEIKISTEGDYFKKLFFEFYPSRLKSLIINPSKSVLKQLTAVSVVIVSEGAGYLWYKIGKS